MKIGICNGFVIVLNAFVRADFLGLKAWKKVIWYYIFTSKETGYFLDIFAFALFDMLINEIRNG